MFIGAAKRLRSLHLLQAVLWAALGVSLRRSAYSYAITYLSDITCSIVCSLLAVLSHAWLCGACRVFLTQRAVWSHSVLVHQQPLDHWATGTLLSSAV